MYDVIVVGCGASGIIAAIFSKKKNNKVLVLERNNSLLKKVLMTGNGRCNYFNEVFNKDCYYGENIDLIEKIISDKNINEILDFFKSIGLIPKIKNGYYYPVTNQALTVKNLLIDEAKRVGVEFVCNSLVTDIKKSWGKFIVSVDNKEYTSSNLVLSTGSYAYPKTGSDGMGYDFLKKFGHKIVKPLPGLVPLISDFKYCKDWDGVRCDCSLELFQDGEFKLREEGEVQLTKYGISGICTFNLSHLVSRGLDQGMKQVISINFVPFIKTFITPWMDTYSKNNPERNLNDLLLGIINNKLVPIILKVSGIDGKVYYKDLDNETKLKLCKNLKGLKINITGTKDFDNAQVCNGGLLLKEVDCSTMESKKVKGLFVVGELLDMTGKCGGYNLAESFITGMLAGKRIGDFYD